VGIAALVRDSRGIFPPQRVERTGSTLCGSTGAGRLALVRADGASRQDTYRRSIRLSVQPDALYLQETGLMRHPRLAIPWPEIHSASNSRVYGRPTMKVCVVGLRPGRWSFRWISTTPCSGLEPYRGLRGRSAVSGSAQGHALRGERLHHRFVQFRIEQ